MRHWRGYFLKVHPLVYLALCILFLSAAVIYAYIQLFALRNQVLSLTSNLASTTAALATTSEKLALGLSTVDQKAAELSSTLSATQQKIVETQSGVESVRTQVGGFEQQVGAITTTVGTLEKLSKTDPELLQKYSKIFFLNEHYAPERVSEIPKEYLYDENGSEVIHAQVWPYLKMLLDAAKNEGVTLYIKSAYRSFDEQKALKGAYTVTYGAGTANQFSADQGYSEHQLGTTVDFITTGLGGQLAGFDTTQAYQWLVAHAHKFGFTLSYPHNNTYYIFEPWHWRYVGVELATYLQNTNNHFYNLEQRTIDEYLVTLF